MDEIILNDPTDNFREFVIEELAYLVFGDDPGDVDLRLLETWFDNSGLPAAILDTTSSGKLGLYMVILSTITDLVYGPESTRPHKQLIRHWLDSIDVRQQISELKKSDITPVSS